jgi:threonylcarbamoyladenosine tRNA methylthiotransferase CDKAL1
MIKMRVFVRSFGCSANLSDGEVIAGCLSSAGYKLTNSEDTADLIIFNSCAVKGPTENRIINAIKKTPIDKLIIVAGCLPLINIERLSREVRFNAIVGPAAGENIVNIVNRVGNGENVIALEDALIAQPRLNLPHIKTNPVISVISINYGCLGSCAYCCVKHARGNLRSYKIPEILERIKFDLASGVREFWITSQDVACYGKDVQTNLVSLLDELVALEGDFRIRVGMMTPNIVTPLLDELIRVFRSEKIFKFLHLPVQSGDNNVLKKMCRFYTVVDFTKIVDAFRLVFPQITLSTDIICGFPGESIEAHQNTLKLLEEVKPDVVNISKFFARPKTAAWDMRSIFIDRDIINHRTSEIAAFTKRIGFERNQSWVNWTGDVFVDEKGKVPDSWIGRNFVYKPIVIKNSENLIGKTLQVKIIKAFSTHLIGTIE